MIQLYGVFLNDDKPFFLQIQRIFGINKTRATILCKLMGINEFCLVNQLDSEQIRFLKRFLYKRFCLGSDLRVRVLANIARLKKIKCHRGFRHILCLPTRGQRSKTNAKTQKRRKRSNVLRTSKVKDKKKKKK